MSADPQVCSTRRNADARAKMLGISGNRDHRLGGSLEQEVIDDRLVLAGDVVDRRGQREDDVVIRDRQQLGFAVGQPFIGRRALTFWTVPVATAVVGDDFVGAILATRHMAAEGRRTTALDGGHDLQLVETDMTGVGIAPRRSVVAKNIRDLQNRPNHDRWIYAGSCSLGGFGKTRRSSGLVTCRIVLTATRV